MFKEFIVRLPITSVPIPDDPNGATAEAIPLPPGTFWSVEAPERYDGHGLFLVRTEGEPYPDTDWWLNSTDLLSMDPDTAHLHGVTSPEVLAGSLPVDVETLKRQRIEQFRGRYRRRIDEKYDLDTRIEAALGILSANSVTEIKTFVQTHLDAFKAARTAINAAKTGTEVMKVKLGTEAV